MKFTRLYQPRNPKFWLLLALNGLNTALGWIARNLDLPWPAALLVAVFAVGNAVLCVALMLELIKNPPPPPPPQQ
jgi:RsiW-degrading membrane proteinase PrsW (M82 family)